METWALIAAILLTSAVAGVIIGILIVSRTESNQQEVYPDPNAWSGAKWRIELWDIGLGICAQDTFDGGVVLGRGAIGWSRQGYLSIGQDVTISRDHCLIYEQNGNTWICNLSEINPTYMNGSELTQPTPVAPGDRLSIGNHIFLITALNRMG